jgi:hypothetical protein
VLQQLEQSIRADNSRKHSKASRLPVVTSAKLFAAVEE